MTKKEILSCVKLMLPPNLISLRCQTGRSLCLQVENDVIMTSFTHNLGVASVSETYKERLTEAKLAVAST